MNRVLLTTLFVALMTPLSLLGQTFTFDIEPDSFAFPNPSLAQYNYGDTVSYRFFLSHLQSTTHLDTIYIFQRVNNGPTDLVLQTTTPIPPSTLIPFAFQDTILATRYGGGINIVVIWPEGPSIISSDSASTDVFVDEPLVAVASEDRLNIMVFPNPTTDELRLKYGFSETMVMGMELRDVQGRLLRSFEALPSSISLRDLAPGMYVVSMTRSDGRVDSFRVVKRAN